MWREKDQTVIPLGAGKGTSQTFVIRSPNETGRYYYFACVEVVPGEINSNNNCSASSSAVEVAAPDLLVLTPSTTKMDFLLEEEFELSVVVSNVGTTNADSSTLTYYRSTDQFLSVDDDMMDGEEQMVSSLGVNEGITVTSPTRAPNISGTYYYFACVGKVNGEINTANNCSTMPAQVFVLIPDLVAFMPRLTFTSLTQGQPFTLSASVSNLGNIAAASSLLTLYQFTNRLLDIPRLRYCIQIRYLP